MLIIILCALRVKENVGFLLWDIMRSSYSGAEKNNIK